MLAYLLHHSPFLLLAKTHEGGDTVGKGKGLESALRKETKEHRYLY